MLELWKFKEDHHNDIETCLQETCIMSNGMIVKFNGKAFFNLLKTLGHTVMSFNNCDCHKNQTLRG